MKITHILVLLLLPLTLSACGQPGGSADGESSGGFGSAISGMFGQTEDEKALHQAQREKIIGLKEEQQRLQKARTEAVLSTRQEGEPVTP